VTIDHISVTTGGAFL